MKRFAAAASLLCSYLACSLAAAQLSRPSSEELLRSGNGPGPVPGGSPGNPLPAITDLAPPSDPRDFSGTWRQARGAAGGGRAGGPPSGAGLPGLRGAAPAGAVRTASGQLPARILCLPSAGITVGGDGPLLIVQTAEQITWAAEEMHVVRRIFLQGDHSAGFQPNHLGEAIGRWESDTLVVETRGLKSLPAGARQIERWNKLDAGRTLEISVESVDRNGASLGTARVQRLGWRPGEQSMEWMCEDYNDEWLPGGADYQDQVSR